MANDQHDNEQTDREMLARFNADFEDAVEHGGVLPEWPPTGRLITRSDLDQWVLDNEIRGWEPTDDDLINWREADDYRDDAPDPGE